MKKRLVTVLTTVLMVFSMLPIGAGVTYASEPEETLPEIDLSSVSVTLPEGKTSVISGDKVKFAVKVKNEVREVEFSIASTKSRQVRTVTLDYNQNSSRWEGEYTITENDINEEWCIRDIYAEKMAYHGTFIFNNTYWSGYDPGSLLADLSDYNFTVAKSCKVTFDTNGGSKIDSQYVIPGEKATLPDPEPTKEENFNFGGWYRDEELTKEFRFNEDTVNEDMTLFAKWTVWGGIGTYDASKGVTCAGGQYTNDYNKAYGHEDDRTYSCFEINEKPNSKFILKAYPDTDYVFKGWFEGKMVWDYPDGQGHNGGGIIPKDLNDPSTLLSTDPEYTFTLDHSSFVCAVFKKSNDNQPDQITPTAPDGTQPGVDLSSVSVSLPEGKNSVITGDKVEFAVKAANNKVDHVEFSIASTKSRQVRNVVLDYNPNSKRWEGEYTIAENDIIEEWCIKEIYARAGENRTFVLNNKYWLGYEPPVKRVETDLSAYNFTVAKSCKVTFDTNGGCKIDPQYVVPGGKATLPNPEPKKEEGFNFGGWYQDEELTKEFSFYNVDPVNEDITLFAKWSIVGGASPYDASTGIAGAGGQYTIDKKEGVESEQTYLTYTLYEAPNSVFTFKAYPDTDYEFKGWFEGKMVWDYPNGQGYDGQGVIPKDLSDPSTLLSSDTEYTFTYDHSVYICGVFAKKDDTLIQKYKVTFNTNGGSKIDSQYVVAGEKATRPNSDPQKEGFTFGGWYQDVALTKEFDFSAPVKGDTTIYAKWLIVGGVGSYDSTTEKVCAGGQYTINEKGYEDSQTYNNTWMNAESNSKRTVKAYPDKGYVFKGWFEGKPVENYSDGQGGKLKTVIPKDLNDPSTLLSADLEYTFTMDRSIYLCAVFAKVQKITPTVTLSAASYTWDGKEKKPNVTVKAGKKTLPASCYTVVYKNNKDVGKASAVVTLKGSYSGSATAYFTINPKSTVLKKTVKGSKAVTVKWKAQAAKMSSSRISGYQIQLATNSKFTKGKKTVNVSGCSKVSKKVGGLKGNRKYYIRIRTYKTIDGKKYYSSWSKPKTVTTKR